jgi:hypothetical protein
MAVIWTTTPWTIPANQALNLNPEIVYALVATKRGHLVLAQDLVERCLARYKLEGKIVATATGAALELIRFRHPLYDRASPVYLGAYVTLDQGTGIVHSSPAYGVDDFQSCRRYGMKDDDILNPVAGGARAGACRSSAARRSGSQPALSSTSCAAPALLRPSSAQLHALLATSHADHLSRDDAMVRRHGRRARMAWQKPAKRCAKRRSPASTRSSTRRGQGRLTA